MAEYTTPVNQFLKSIDIQPYDRYLPNAFNDSLTMLEKVNKIIYQLNETNQLTNDVVDKWNQFVEWVNHDGLDEPIELKVNELLKHDSLIELINTELMGEFKREITESTNQQLNGLDNQLTELMDDKEDHGGLTLSEIEVPTYARNEFSNTIAKINQNRKNNSILFGAIADPHLGTVRWAGRTSAYHLKAISLFSKQQPLSFILGLGDMIDGANTGENVRHCLKEGAKCFEEANCDVLLAKGDHDINANYLYNYASTNPYNVEPSSIITKNDWNDIMVTPELTGGNLVTNTSDADSPKFKPNYFYKDYENEKIRVIVLDTMDTFHSINKYFADQLYTRGRFTYGFNNSQLNWLGNVALDFSNKTDKSEWTIVLTSHCNPKKAATVGDMRNSNVAIGLVKACMNGTSYTIPSQAGEFSLTPQTVDFATKNGGGIKVAGWLHGHDHRDLHEVDGFNIIGIVNSYGLFLDNSDRHINKLLEDAWSVFVLNKDTRQLVEIRYGYSDSNNPTGLRTFTY